MRRADVAKALAQCASQQHLWASLAKLRGANVNEENRWGWRPLLVPRGRRPKRLDLFLRGTAAPLPAATEETEREHRSAQPSAPLNAGAGAAGVSGVRACVCVCVLVVVGVVVVVVVVAHLSAGGGAAGAAASELGENS